MRFLIAILLFCIIAVWTGAQQSQDHKRPSAKFGLVFVVPVPEDASPHETPPDELPVSEISDEISGKTTAEEPSTGRPILGKGKTRAEKLVSFFLSENKNADRAFVEELAFIYIAEAENEGINHDIAFVQMCLETGFLRFGGLVKPEMNNFCGLGAIGPGQPGVSFPTAQIGIRAHIQHLKAYATELPLKGELVDPRYHLVRRGSVPEVQGLAGTWAADRNYAQKIETILERLYRFGASLE
jgi:hypothetical protein